MAASLLRTALLSAAAVASVAAKPRGPENIDRQSSEPCAQVSKAFSGGNSIFISADTALACLQSVPLDKNRNIDQLAGLKDLIGFQSDLSYLIKPPPGYLYPAVDVLGGLDKIGGNLASGVYTNEYDFQMDIYKLVAATYDGHFTYVPDILGVFFWMRLVDEHLAGGLPQYYQLISVSTDGVELPNVYSLLDGDALLHSGSAGYTASPISQINGDDVEDWLNTYATTNGNSRQQDPDANYNGLFPSLSTDSVPALLDSFGNIFAKPGVYQGSDTVLKFVNGSTVHVPTVAATSSETRDLFRRVTDGASFFQTFCTNNYLQEVRGGIASSSLPASPASSSFPASSGFFKRAAVTERAPQASSSFAFGSFSSAALSSQIVSQPAASGSAAPVPSSQVPYKAVPTATIKPGSAVFPDPFVASDDFSVVGYFPDGQNDLAVLAIPSYEPVSPSQFSNVVRELLATSKANNRTKLIIDLRGNPGGIALMATDTFKQLFPSQDPYGAGNYRANALFNFTGQSLSDFYNGVTYKQSQAQGTDGAYAGTPFNVDNEVTKAAKDFNSWADFFGPEYYHGDNYTELTRWNLSDPAQRTGLSVYGYGVDDGSQPQTFQPENIVMLHDGACASTCTLFAELMKNQAHVRSIVVGGRKQTGPMQGVGGIKGANILGMSTIFQLIGFAYSQASSSLQQYFQQHFGLFLNQAVVALSRATPSPSPSNVVQATFNFRNNFRDGDSTNTPLQYVYEASDWRFFYTAQMYVQQEEVWTKAYNIVWNGANAVAGSTGHASSGFGTGYILSPPPAGVAMGESIFPSKNLGKPVKPSATASFGPKKSDNAAAGVGVSAGVMIGGLAAAMALM